jgi:segregation and condensation protein A
MQPQTTNLHVKTSVYEGPLELLLELIEKRKLHINDISLAQVADEYMARIQAASELPIGETANFVALAATLLLIKSRSLLPNLNLTDEESRDIKELEYRLAVYQIIKEASREVTPGLYLYEGRTPEAPPMYLPDPAVSLASLRSAAQVLIEGFPQTLVLPKVEVKKIISLEEMIESMATRISSAFRMSFKEFSKGERQTVIVSFLALLELVKQGIIKASQEEGGDIMLEQDSVATPTYE